MCALEHYPYLEGHTTGEGAGDLFDNKALMPMLIGAEGEAFDSADYIHEIKWDGVRCLAFVEQGKVTLVNKRQLLVSRLYPELADIHQRVCGRCILDGELMVMKDGKPYFAKMQRRALMSNQIKISLAARELPVSFTAYDILYRDGQDITKQPLMARKSILEEVVDETPRIAISRYIDTQGIALYAQAEKLGMEGIVSKRKKSLYYSGKRTKDWIKVKNLMDADCVICGYINKDKGVISIVLGQYDNCGGMVYMGHVTMGLSNAVFGRIDALPRREVHPFTGEIPKSNNTAVWVEPVLVCTVKFMEYTPGGGFRQPVMKGLRDDKAPRECIVDKG